MTKLYEPTLRRTNRQRWDRKKKMTTTQDKPPETMWMISDPTNAWLSWADTVATPPALTYAMDGLFRVTPPDYPAARKPDATALDVLEHTQVVLERQGWTQGASRDAQGRVCFGFALATALRELLGYKFDGGHNRTWLTVVQLVYRAITNGRDIAKSADIPWSAYLAKSADIPWSVYLLVDPYLGIAPWNDMHGRTYEDVKLVLKQAIEYARTEASTA